MKTTTILTLSALLVMGTLASAQQLVRLDNGNVLEARTKKRGSKVVLKTVFGSMRVSKKQIQETSSAKETRAEYERLIATAPKDKVAEQKAIAQWCQKKGLLSGLRERLNVILEQDIDHPWANKVVADLAKRFSVHDSEGGTRGRDQRRFYDYLLLKLAAQDRVGSLIARTKVKRIPEEIVLRPAIKHMKSKKEGTRWLAAQLLRPFTRTPDRIVPLYRRSLSDPSRDVRREAVLSLEVTKDPVFVKLFSKNLYSASPAIRINAAEALGNMGMKEAIAPLITALADSGSSQRAHILRTKHQAYVKDFDVEIAQAAVIADPIIDVATEGGVLDVGLVGVFAQRRAIAGALATLSGVDHGLNAKAWAEWHQSQQSK